MGISPANAGILWAESHTPGFVVSVGTPQTITTGLAITLSNFPAGYQAGDVLIAWAERNTGSLTVSGSTAGWTYCTSTLATRGCAAFRVATGTDNSPQFAASGANANWSGAIAAIRGCSLINPVVASGNMDQSGNANGIQEFFPACNFASMAIVPCGGSTNNSVMSQTQPGWTTDLAFNDATHPGLILAHHVVTVQGEQPIVTLVNTISTGPNTATTIELRPLN